MTREEAIRHIRDVIAENNSIKPNIVTFEQEKEALNMAIEALEQERPEIIRCENCRHDNNCEIQYAAQAGSKFFCGSAERREK